MDGKRYTITELVMERINGNGSNKVLTRGKVESKKENFTKYGDEYATYYVSDGANQIRATDFRTDAERIGCGMGVEITGVLEEYNAIPYINVESIVETDEVVEDISNFTPKDLTIKKILELLISEKDTGKFLAKTAGNCVRFIGRVTGKEKKIARNSNTYLEYCIEQDGSSIICRDFEHIDEVDLTDTVEVTGFVQRIYKKDAVLIESIHLYEQPEYVASEEDFQKVEEDSEIESGGIQQTPVADIGSIEDDSDFLGFRDHFEGIPLFQMVINEDLLDKIEKFGKNDKKRLDKALRNLQYGNWKSGIKVKKLAGIAENVMEARLDRDRRILFQMRRVPVKDSTTLRETIILQDIVRHKKITDAASKIQKESVERINLQNYNAHLQGKVEREMEIKEEIKETVNLKELIFESSENDMDSTGLPNGIKHYRFDDEIREEFIDGIPRRFLALSPRQQEIVFSRGPLMVNGGAGTGKTTILTHTYLLKKQNVQKNKLLYITLTPQLKEYISRLIQEMTRKNETGDSTIDIDGIMTFNELCKRILGSEETKFREDDEIMVTDFTEWVKRYPKYRNYDPLQLWQEYYGVIKGSSKNGGIITKIEYLKKGRDVSPFNEKDRKIVYDIIQEYHTTVNSSRHWDSIDLAQATILKLEKRVMDRIDGVICDEIQDFTQTQYAIFPKLLKESSYDSLYFGGDILQSINSSNFRWEDLRLFLYKEFGEDRKITDLIQMNRNFRSTSKMIDIANRFIQLKKKLGINNTEDELQKAVEELDTKHAPGMLIHQKLEELKQSFEILKEKMARDRMIIVYSEEKKQIIAEYFDENSIFTILEVKGLEFRNTFLFNLASDTGIDWRKMFGDRSKEYIEINRLMIRYAFNRIYVALTRARRHMIIYEENEEAYKLWDELKGETLKVTPLDMMERFWTEDLKEEELLQSAEYFKMHKRYGLAADYFHRCNKTKEARECKARDALERKIYQKAAWIFEEIDFKEEAAKAYEHFDIEKAEELYRALKSEIGVKRCEARKFEKKENYRQAGELLRSIGEFQDAIENFQKIHDKKEVARTQAMLHEKYNEFEEAAEQWKLAGDSVREKISLSKNYELEGEYELAAKTVEEVDEWELARSFWEKAGNNMRVKFCLAKTLQNEKKFEKADELFKEIGEWNQRIEMWKELEDNSRIAEIYFQLGQRDPNAYTEAAKYWLKIGEKGRALEIVDSVRDLDTRIQIYLSHEDNSKVAENYENAGRFNLAGDYWVLAENLDSALECYTQVNNEKKIMDVLVKMERWEEAAELAVKQSEWEIALECYRELNDLKNMALCSSKLERWAESGQYYQKAGEKLKAAEAYKKANSWKKAAELYHEMEKYQEAAESYENASKQASEKWFIMFRLAGENWLKVPDRERAKEAFRRGRADKLLVKVLEEDEEWGKLANHYKQKKRYSQSAKYYEKAGNMSQAMGMYRSAKKYKDAIKLALELDLENTGTDKDIELLADIYELNKNYEESARLLEKLKFWDKAAVNYIRVNDEVKAEIKKRRKESNKKWKSDQDKSESHKQEVKLELNSQLKPLTNKRKRVTNKVISCYEKAEKFKEAAKYAEVENAKIRAAQIYQKMGDYKKSAKMFEDRKRYSDAAESWKKEEDWGKAAENYEKAELLDKAALMREKAKEWKLALDLYSKLGRANKIALCYEKLNDFQNAALKWEDSANLTGNVREWGYAGNNYEKIGDKENAIRCFEKADDTEKLEELVDDEENLKKLLEKYTKAGNRRKIAETYEKLGDYKSAAEQWEQFGKNIKAARNWEKVKNMEKVEELLADNPYELGKYYERMEYWVKAGQSFKKANKIDRAIENYTKAGMMEEVRRLKKLQKSKKGGKKGGKKKKNTRRGSS